MKFLSVCSGIEAASVAWNPLGWEAAAFAEIEPFPCAVLAHHYPHVPNWGDMTNFKEWPDVSIDLLCGGTPCQSFSVAGLRKGLDDPRGNLMLTFGAIAAKYRPRWLVWENVPGVLSSNGGRDFGSFLGLLGVLGYGFAYRVLDAQYFGVAQRRRRVFVVGCLGDWRSAAAVLFERHSLSGHPAPRREARKGSAGGPDGRAAVSSGHGWWDESDVAATLRAQDSVTKADTLHIAGTLNSRTTAGGGLGTDFELGSGLATDKGAEAGHILAFKPGQSEAAGGTFVTEDFAPTLQAQNNGSTAVPAVLAFGGNRTSGSIDIAPALLAQPGSGWKGDFDSETFITTHTLRGEGFDASENSRHELRLEGGDGQRTGALSTGGGKPGQGVPMIAFPANLSGTQCASAVDVAPSMGAANPTAVAFNFHKSGNEASSLGVSVERVDCLRAFEKSPMAVQPAAGMQVRRLTPEECEALQGFPRGYTNVPHRNKPAADGPRYKSLGNSWAVPNVRWIGQRIDAVQALIDARQEIAA